MFTLNNIILLSIACINETSKACIADIINYVNFIIDYSKKTVTFNYSSNFISSALNHLVKNSKVLKTIVDNKNAYQILDRGIDQLLKVCDLQQTAAAVIKAKKTGNNLISVAAPKLIKSNIHSNTTSNYIDWYIRIKDLTVKVLSTIVADIIAIIKKSETGYMQAGSIAYKLINETGYDNIQSELKSVVNSIVCKNKDVFNITIQEKSGKFKKFISLVK